MKIKVTAALLAAFMLLSLASCSGNDNPSNTSGGSKDIPVLSTSAKVTTSTPTISPDTTTEDPSVTTTDPSQTSEDPAKTSQTSDTSATSDKTTTTSGTTVVQKETFIAANDTVYVTSEALNLRISPSAANNDNVYTQAALGTALKRTGYNDNWTRVEYKNKILYVSTKYVSTENPTATIEFTTCYETVYVTSNLLYLREQPSMIDSIGIISETVPAGTELVRIGYEETWSKVTYNGKTLYCGTKYISTEKPAATTTN